MGRAPFSSPLPGNQERAIGILGLAEPTTGSLSGAINSYATGTGGQVTTDEAGTDLSVSSDTNDVATIALAPAPNRFTTGRFITEFVWRVNEPLDGLENTMHIGQVISTLPSDDNQEGARFAPTAGDNTDGNVEVETGGYADGE